MSESNPSSSAPASKTGVSAGRILFLFIAVFVLAGGVYAYFQFANIPSDKLANAQILKCYLFDADKYAKLAYPDADGDLVADCPAAGPYLDPPELIFEEVVGDDAALRVKQWDAFLKHLSTATGKPVKYRKFEEIVEPAHLSEDGELQPERRIIASGTWKQQIEALKLGQIHIAAFSTGQVPIAVNGGGFVPLFAPADAAGNFGYEMEVVVKSDSALQTIADLKGKKVAFVALSSNSGAKAPLVIFEEQFGMKPFRDYEFELMGRHELGIQRVAEGKVAAACVANDILRGERATGVLKDNPQAVRTIFKSETFPAVCFGIPHNLDPALTAKIKEAFTSFKFEGTGIADRYRNQRVKFVPVNYQKDWAFVRDMEQRLLKNIQAK